MRRPYVYIYNNEKDPVERGLINLAAAQVDFNEEQQVLLKVIYSHQYPPQKLNFTKTSVQIFFQSS